MEEGEPVGQHFNGPVVDDGRIQVHSAEGHVRCDACTRLAADARQCPLERHGAGPQDTGLCAGGAMVAEGVQRAATGAGVGTVGQWEPEASQQEDSEERILDAELDGRGECGKGPAGVRACLGQHECAPRCVEGGKERCELGVVSGVACCTLPAAGWVGQSAFGWVWPRCCGEGLPWGRCEPGVAHGCGGAAGGVHIGGDGSGLPCE